MSNRKLSNTAKILIAAREIIADQNHWTQGAYEHHTEDGVVQFCIYGALHSVADSYHESSDAVEESAEVLYDKPAVEVNDNMGYEAIMRVVDHAIQHELNKVPA